MVKSASARRYAQAAFELGSESGEADIWLDDLSTIAAALDNGEFSQYLDAPQISEDQKVALISKVMGDSIGQLPKNMLCLLANRSCTNLFPEIISRYQELVDRRNGIERAEVVSAVPLSDDQNNAVYELLKTLVNKNIEMTTHVDSEILGGLIAKVGDQVVDGSTRSRLNALRRQIA